MDKDWQKLSGLVVGFGSAGRRHVRILQELGLGELAVCDTNRDCLAIAQTEFGISRTFSSFRRALESKPEVVFICSPTAHHAEQAIEAVEAGADVFVEKPLSTSLEPIDRLAKRTERSGRIVMVGHCFRFHEGLRIAKEWLTEGRIGRLVSIRASMGEYIPEVMPNYRNMYIARYSGAYELMHDIDLALWFASRPLNRVFGLEGNLSDAGMDSPDLVEILLEFEDRCVANVHLDFFQRVRRRQTELLGTEGTIIVEFARWEKCQVSLFESATRTWSNRVLETKRDDMFREEDRLFLEAVINRSPVPVDIGEARRAVEVTVAAQESARTRRGVTLRKPVKVGTPHGVR